MYTTQGYPIDSRLRSRAEHDRRARRRRRAQAGRGSSDVGRLLGRLLGARRR